MSYIPPLLQYLIVRINDIVSQVSLVNHDMFYLDWITFLKAHFANHPAVAKPDTAYL